MPKSNITNSGYHLVPCRKFKEEILCQKKNNNILQAARFHKNCRAATDEIFGSLEVCPTGNYWFNNQYNLFVTKETEKDREQYFLLKLEKYDGEDCVDFEFDTEDTSSDSEAQLLFAIGNIIEVQL